MAGRFQWTILSLFLLCSITTAQKTPDYKERSFQVFSDTLEIEGSYFLTGSEGAIDPAEYILGPGDILMISISGLQENTFKIPVDYEGNLYIPKIGGIILKDNSLAEAKEKITRAINRYYKDVDIFITLADFKKIKVSFIGDVIKPSTHVLPGNARLLDLVTVSGGMNNTANYRNISIRNREKTNEYDLLSFLRYGELKQNPVLREGDIVVVDKVDKVVSLSGWVKYPGSYEFNGNETVADLITLAGGLLNKARQDSIEVISFNEEGSAQVSSYYSYDYLKMNNIRLKNQDHIVVREIPDFMIDRYVTITGYVRYPGFYKIIKNKTTLNDIISEAGGFRSEASLVGATITRTSGTEVLDPEFERLKLLQRSEMTDDEYDYLKAKSRQRIGKVVVDFVRLFEEKAADEDIVLVNGDVINIPQKVDYIILLGQVVNPGNIIYNQDYSYQDYIRAAGGFGWRALDDEVRVIKANTGEWIYADEIEQIEPGDAIWIPEDPPGPKFWDVFTESLNVVGQLATVIAAIAAIIIASR